LYRRKRKAVTAAAVPAQSWRRHRRAKAAIALAVAAVVPLLGSSARATNGTWTGTSGTWSTTGNWQSGAVANGSGAIANFENVDVSNGDYTVTLTAPITVGSRAVWRLRRRLGPQLDRRQQYP